MGKSWEQVSLCLTEHRLVFSASVRVAVKQTSELIEHALAKRNRIGLLTAFRKLIMELTLLGFVSLILILFQSSLTKICGTSLVD